MIFQMKTLDTATIASVQLGMFDNFRPTIEFDFGDGQAMITEHPQRIINSGNFNKVPYMVGVNSGEGILLATRKFEMETSNSPENLINSRDRILSSNYFYNAKLE